MISESITWIWSKNWRFAFRAVLLLWVMRRFWRVWGNLALNAKIVEIVFSQWDLGVCQERILMLQLRFGPPRSKIQHPKPSVKFLVTSGGSAGDPFMPSKSHVPNYFPFRIHGLGT